MMLRALLVEDNLYDRNGILNHIPWKDLGISEMDIGVNGAQGLAKAREHRPDIVITDISMPVMDGMEMIKKLGEEFPGIKYIIMSCHDEFDFVKAAINLNVSSYILKPVDLNELTEAVRKAVSEVKKEMNLRIDEQRLKEKLKNSLPALQSDLLREILHSKKPNNDFQRRMQYLEMEIHKDLVVAVVEYDQSSAISSISEDEYLLSYILKNAFQDTFFPKITSYSYIMDYKSICCLITGNWETQEECYAQVIGYFMELKSSIQESTSSSLTIGLSNMTDSLFALPAAFREAYDSSRLKFYSAGNRIIAASEVKKELIDRPLNLGKFQEHLTQALESDEKSAVKALMDKYASEFSQVEKSQIVSNCYAMVFLIQEYFREHHIETQDIAKDPAPFWKAPDNFETISHVRSWMEKVLYSCWEYLQKNRTSRYGVIIQQIRDKIDRDYATIDSISSMVKELYISPGYANVLFKQEVGMTIGDYLFQKKMEAAKEMLTDPHCRIYEVSDRLGYVSKSYFSAVFKEYTGLSPKEYRDRHCVKAGG